MTFELTEEQWKRYGEWADKIERDYPAKSGAIGGRFTFSFTPTSLGVAVKVTAAMPFDGKLVIDLSDYKDW